MKALLLIHSLFIFEFITGIHTTDFWTTREVNQIKTGNNSLPFHISTNVTFCKFETIFLQWVYHTTSGDDSHSSNFMIGISKSESSKLLTKSLYKCIDHGFCFEPMESSNDVTETYDGIIKCDLNENYCIPSVVNLVAINENPNELKLVIYFNVATNQPVLLSPSQLLSALSFYPPVVGFITGHWLDPTKLELQVEDAYYDDVIKYHSTGNPIIIKPINKPQLLPQNSPFSISGVFQLQLSNQISTLKDYEIFIIDSINMTIISNKIDLSTCTPTHRHPVAVIPNIVETVNNKEEEKMISKPFYHIKGIMAINGQDGYTVPTFPSSQKGTFSISFWVLFLHEPRSQFISLFFKGTRYLLM